MALISLPNRAVRNLEVNAPVIIGLSRGRDIEIPELEQVLRGRAAIGDFKVLGSSLEIQALCAQCSEGIRPRRAKRTSSAHKSA